MCQQGRASSFSFKQKVHARLVFIYFCGDNPTQRGARTMALDPKTHRIFLVTAEYGPAPAATAGNPRPRPAIVPGTFIVLVVER
jgi:hypothetical protein